MAGMKLIRFGNANGERPGLLLDDGRRIDVSECVPDYDPGFFENGGMADLAGWVEAGETANAPVVAEQVRWGPPVANPGKILCIGLNYRDHAEETGAEIPSEPIVFSKAVSALCGPMDDVLIPRQSKKTDWEVELTVVIGARASYVSEDEAMDYVAGYALMNDYSEREFQAERGGQWVKGKSADTFAPLGPFIATRDEIADVHNLDMWLTVNGESVQKSNTSNLIFKVPFLVSYLSQFMSLLPGDVISTGTPGGVGMGMDPPRFLQENDVVELGIEGLGSSKQKAGRA